MYRKYDVCESSSWIYKIPYGLQKLRSKNCLLPGYNCLLKSVLKTSKNDNVYRKMSLCTLVKFHRNIFSPSGVKKNFNQE